MKTRAIIIILVLLAIILLVPIVFRPKDVIAPVKESSVIKQEEIKDTYTYTNHGFSIELPKEYKPEENTNARGTSTEIFLPNSLLTYITDVSAWESNAGSNFENRGSEKIGSTTFKVYYNKFTEGNIYWFKQGKVGYAFSGDKKLLETFKFVGWPQIEGNKDDLVSFSIKPGQEVSGKVSFTGSIKGGYFFEGNFLLGVLDANKKDINIKHDITKETTSDWMTAGPVSIKGMIDFTNLPKGKAYIAIIADDPRDASERGNDPIKQILIPIIIK